MVVLRKTSAEHQAIAREASSMGMSARKTHPTGLVVLPDKESIRLLHLLPAQHPTDPIVCELTAASLTSSVSYEALSYTCGTPIFDTTLDSQTISLCGAQQAVTGNLYDALRQLRLPSATRVLWADSLCIDQDDPVEKASQVARMHLVYKHATRVLLWLGNDCEAFDGELCIAFFRQCLSAHDEAPLIDDMQPIYGYDGEDDGACSNTEVEARLEQIAVALDSELLKKAAKSKFHAQYSRHEGEVMRSYVNRPSALMSSIVGAWVCTWRRRYFTRRWVIQELLNAREVILRCGGSSMPWPEYRRASALSQRIWLNLGWYGSGEDNTYQVALRCRPQEGCSTLFRLEEHDGQLEPMFELFFVEAEIRDGRRDAERIAQLRTLNPTQKPAEVSEEENMLRLMFLLRDFECEDPRDRIYALTGALSRPLATSVKPDYTITTSECFTRFASDLVRAHSTMRVLYQAMHQIRLQNLLADLRPQRPLRDADLPSWVPDWSLKVQNDVQIFYAEDRDYTTVAPVVDSSGSLLMTAVSLGTCCGRCYEKIRSVHGDSTDLVRPGESVLLSRTMLWQDDLQGPALTPAPQCAHSYTVVGERHWMRVDRDRDCWCAKPVTTDIRIL